MCLRTSWMRDRKYRLLTSCVRDKLAECETAEAALDQTAYINVEPVVSWWAGLLAKW